MTDTKHTPTPWILDECCYGDNIIIGSDESLVCIDTEFYPAAPSIEDMNHIVKCVNMHDDLVEALKEAGDVIESYYKSTGIDLGDASNMPFYDDTIRKIDETLKKAGAL